jgi:hypothetical protein
MPRHTCEFKYAYSKEANYSAFQYNVVIGTLAFAKANRFKQIWAAVAGDTGAPTAAFQSYAMVEFWNGYIDPVYGNINGIQLLEIPVRRIDGSKGTPRYLDFNHQNNTAGQGYPVAPFVSYATGSFGIQAFEKSFDCDIACDVVRLRLYGWFNATTTVSGYFSVIASNYPPRMYHEYNFGPNI